MLDNQTSHLQVNVNSEYRQQEKLDEEIHA